MEFINKIIQSSMKCVGHDGLFAQILQFQDYTSQAVFRQKLTSEHNHPNTNHNGVFNF